MNLKRLIGSVVIAGVVGASTLGVGAGVASATTNEPSSGTALVQPADWHGYDRGHDWGHGYGRDYRGGWPINHWWHPWGWPWRW